jgi:signal peptidase I
MPFINAFMVMLMVVETLKCYRIYNLGHQALAVLLPFIYLPWLGVKKQTGYVEPANRVKIKKTPVREWVDAIIFAVIAASIIRIFMVEAYTIPTSSMEKIFACRRFSLCKQTELWPESTQYPGSPSLLCIIPCL